MSDIPHAATLDDSLALLREGYTYISRRCDRLGSDLFTARMMLTPVTCMRGAEAARIFYDNDRFTRQGAMPQITLRLLQDKGSVQGLDGAAHRHRKRMFMGMMTPEALAAMEVLLARRWREAVARWEEQGEVALLPASGEVLTRAACDWCGVPLPDEEAPELTRELAAMVENAGSVGPGALVALGLRQRTEGRMRRLVERVRAGEERAPAGSPLAVIAAHADPDGRLLDSTVAAVELINLLRPLLAVNRFIAFVALALHEHPEWRARFADGDEADLEPFVQEVRRFYPFFPVIGGRARRPFEWSGHAFAEGEWVLLDLYGTNHDARLWPEPEQFRPERFRDWPGDPYTLIPQGAGDFLQGHRCPGEWITIVILKQVVRLLCREMRFEVPPQDLSVSLARMPASPASGFIMSRVRGKAPLPVA
ncbi:cytochrome P450 [Roseomonas sp. E05]|uniref:cytochrome P450 n=1 Tax=Roseomonas sp. E05 TaxID=3046310 RepID=UPI0024BBD960|nr:cytochrome P450 [Roseomonas sp. E05]MDJ0388010.1 cytochrome P450 [Roseomonas sp. E05]